jgi:hypothetical protein
MYSPEIVDRRIRSIESAYHISLHRYDPDESRAISAHVSTAYDDKGRQIRALTGREQDFVWNEIALSRADFVYWAERYCQILVDDEEAIRRPIRLTSAQKIILAKMAKGENRMWEERDRGQTRHDGLCYFMHKAGQMGISTHCEIVGVHRLNFYPDTLGLVASSNDQMTQKLYSDYFLPVYENLPPWMRQPLKSKIKDRGLDFVSNSRAVLQDASQKAAVGQGSKWHYVHLSEVSTWPDPVKSFEGSDGVLPRISRSIKAVAFLESTSAGMQDWWHLRTELARRGEYDRWEYIFIPWYMVPEFYHDYPPDTWIMSKEAQEEAELIERTSWEWNDGATIRPTRQMMYWWEKERRFYQKNGTLNEFYKAHPSIPEQSFTHGGTSSFEYEVLEGLQRGIERPVPYELATASLPSELVLDDREARLLAPWAKTFHVGQYDLVPVRVPLDDQYDPRGLVLLWEQPSEQHDYFGGADPAVGIANWTRYTKSKYDSKRDNSALEIIRRGFYDRPDVQVCEFAAPIFPQDFALYLYVLGRLYRGRSEERGCLMTIEINSHGRYTQEELIQRYDYINLYQRRRSDDGVTVDFTDLFGWRTDNTSIRELWAMGKKHIGDGRFVSRSNWLVTEMRQCQDDDIRYKTTLLGARGKAKGGNKHDDRVYANMFALEGAHSWTHGLLSAPAPAQRPMLVRTDNSGNELKIERDMTAKEYDEYLLEWENAIGEM